MSQPGPGRLEDPPLSAADPLGAAGDLVAADIPVRRVPPGAIAGWLRAGWRDFRRSPVPGLLVGLVCALAGWGILLAVWQAENAMLILPLVTGFMLAAPLLAVPLYETSRRLARGESAGIATLPAGFGRNPRGIGLMGALLLLFLYAWLRVATMTWALFFGPDLPPLGDFLAVALADPRFILASCGTGAVLAALVFSFSAVSLPLLVDRPVDATTAVMTSLRACLLNPATMALWAVVIAAAGLAGIGCGLLGLVLVVPVIGHATWHAHADLVGAEEPGG